MVVSTARFLELGLKCFAILHMIQIIHTRLNGQIPRIRIEIIVDIEESRGTWIVSTARFLELGLKSEQLCPPALVAPEVSTARFLELGLKFAYIAGGEDALCAIVSTARFLELGLK